MSVTLEGKTVVLRGSCGVEEAERLVSLLEETPGRIVDLDACTSLHAALLQALVAYSPSVRGTLRDPFLSEWIMPLLVARPRDLAVSHRDGAS